MSNWLKRSTSRGRKNRRGVLTLEWILLVTILVIGIIAGLGAVRDAIICELGDLANAIAALNISGDEDLQAAPPEQVGP